MQENKLSMPQQWCILSSRGVVKKSEKPSIFFSGPNNLEAVQHNHHLQTSATGALDFGMPLGKLACFSKTVGKLRITSQWLLECKKQRKTSDIIMF